MGHFLRQSWVCRLVTSPSSRDTLSSSFSVQGGVAGATGAAGVEPGGGEVEGAGGAGRSGGSKQYGIYMTIPSEVTWLILGRLTCSSRAMEGKTLSLTVGATSWIQVTRATQVYLLRAMCLALNCPSASCCMAVRDTWRGATSGCYRVGASKFGDIYCHLIDYCVDFLSECW